MPLEKAQSRTRKGASKPAKKATPITPDVAFSKLAGQASGDGSVIIGITSAARHFGKPVSTFSDWLKKWESEGRISMEKQGRGKTKILFLHQRVPATVGDGFAVHSGATDQAPKPTTKEAADGPDSVADFGDDSVAPNRTTESTTDDDGSVVPAATEDVGSVVPSVVPESAEPSPAVAASVVPFPVAPPASNAPEPKRRRRRHRAEPDAPLALPAPKDLARDDQPLALAPATPSTFTAAPATAAEIVEPANLEPETERPVRKRMFLLTLSRRKVSWPLFIISCGFLAASLVQATLHAAERAHGDPLAFFLFGVIALGIGCAAPFCLHEGVHRSTWRDRFPLLVCGLIALTINAVGALGYAGARASNTAAIGSADQETRERDKARLESLLAEEKALRAAAVEAEKTEREQANAELDRLRSEEKALRENRPRPVAEIVAAIAEKEKERVCRWFTPRRSKEKQRSAKCEDALAELAQEKARAERAAEIGAQIQTALEQSSSRLREAVKTRQAKLDALAAQIAEATKKLEGGVIRAAADPAATFIAGLIGVAEDRVRTAFVIGWTLFAEAFAGFGFALAVRHPEEEEGQA